MTKKEKECRGSNSGYRKIVSGINKWYYLKEKVTHGVSVFRGRR